MHNMKHRICITVVQFVIVDNLKYLRINIDDKQLKFETQALVFVAIVNKRFK